MECQGGNECYDAIRKFRDAGVPAYPTAEQGVNALIALRKYARIKEKFSKQK
jgi:acyl-CoA synthetase (NDP forming)